MWKNHVIYLDGDPFHLTIPTYELFMKMVSDEMLRNKNLWDQTLTYRVSLVDDNLLCFYEGVKPGTIGTVRPFIYEAWRGLSASQTVYWRPVLRPLTRSLAVDDVFRVETKDGEVFSGGCLMVNGKFHQTPKDLECPDFLPNVESLDIADLPLEKSDSEPLQWIAKHGVLVCTNSLAKIKLKNLYKLGVLPHT